MDKQNTDKIYAGVQNIIYASPRAFREGTEDGMREADESGWSDCIDGDGEE